MKQQDLTDCLCFLSSLNSLNPGGKGIEIPCHSSLSLKASTGIAVPYAAEDNL